MINIILVDLNIFAFKGQLISKCPFGVIVSTKIPTKKFCPRILKSCEINKIKALFYNTIIYT